MTTQKPELYFGVEIEANTNDKYTKYIAKGEYHGGLPVGNIKWKAEKDSSIVSYGEFGDEDKSIDCNCDCYCRDMDCNCDDYDNCDGSCREDDCNVCRGECEECKENTSCFEFISDLAKGKEEFKERLKLFENYLSQDGKLELKDVLSFNKSCGSHLHFSLAKGNFRFYDKLITFKIFKEVRKRFKYKLKKSNIESKNDILTQYNRSYAKELNDEHLKHKDYLPKDRSFEFNFNSELNGMGLEWRSLNLTNIKTWAEFHEFWDIAIDCIEFLFDKGTKQTYDFGSEEIKGILRKKRYLVSKIEIPKQKHELNEEVSSEEDLNEMGEEPRFDHPPQYNIEGALTI